MDEAFGDDSIVSRSDYAELLEKIHVKASFLYASEDKTEGYVAIYLNDTDSYCAYITLIAVGTAFQRRHVGQSLLSASLMQARLAGMKNCRLEVKKHNIKAIQFYQTNGFVFDKENDDSFYMRKELRE